MTHLHLLPEVASKADAVADATARHPSAHHPSAGTTAPTPAASLTSLGKTASRRTSNGTTVAPATHKQNRRRTEVSTLDTPPAPTTAAS